MPRSCSFSLSLCVSLPNWRVYTEKKKYQHFKWFDRDDNSINFIQIFLSITHKQLVPICSCSPSIVKAFFWLDAWLITPKVQTCWFVEKCNNSLLLSFATKRPKLNEYFIQNHDWHDWLICRVHNTPSQTMLFLMLFVFWIAFSIYL